jgi:7-carboxy-7-deazaguanine synthase
MMNLSPSALLEQPRSLKQATSAPSSAPIQEVFSSVQGEGPYVGQRQVFVRFEQCHLHCAYCDTPMQQPQQQLRVELQPGSQQWHLLPNPTTVPDLLSVLEALIAQVPHHSVSFTGGEPLLYPDFLEKLLPQVQALGVKTYIETSGTQPSRLAKLLPASDIVAMDIKLPSTTKEPPRYEAHQAFYQLAQAEPHTEVFIKLVVNNETNAEELAAVRRIVSHQDCPIFLQPEMPNLLQSQVLPQAERLVPHITAQHLLGLQAQLAQHFTQVRVVPQTHKLLGVS